MLIDDCGTLFSSTCDASFFPFKMSDENQRVARKAWELAIENLREAQQELKEWKAIFFEDKTKTEQTLDDFDKNDRTIKLEAKIKDCAARERYLSEIAENRGILD